MTRDEFEDELEKLKYAATSYGKSPFKVALNAMDIYTRKILAEYDRLKRIEDAAKNLITCGPLCDTKYWDELRKEMEA